MSSARTLLLCLALLSPMAAAQTPDPQANPDYAFEAEQARKREMEAAKKLLESPTLDDFQRADLMLRLADLTFEEGRSLYLKAWDACYAEPSCTEPDLSESRTWLEGSVRITEKLLRDHPSYPGTDEALYALAHTQQELGQLDEANARYTELVRRFPDSEKAPQAFLQIGEYRFERGELMPALNAYRRAAAFEGFEERPYALYKEAWVLYNLGEYATALDTMQQVVILSEDSALPLEQEAMRDMVRICVDADQPEKCVTFFEGRGDTELVQSTLRDLANTYLESGDHEKAIQTWKRLIASDPRSEHAAHHQHQILRAWASAGRLDQALDALDVLVDDYGAASTWARHNAARPDALEEAQSTIETDLRELAIGWHTQARKLGTGPDALRHYEAADQLYTLYLERWPDGAHGYDMRYAHAELLWDTERYAEAWQAYTQVVELDPRGTKSLEAAEAAVHCAEKLAPEPPVAEGLEPITMEPWTHKLLDSLDTYTSLYPTGPRTREAMYRSAWLYYRHNEFAEAATRFRVVIALDPSSREAEYAADLILTQLEMTQAWEELAATAHAFANEPRLASEDFRRNAGVIEGNAALVLADKDPDAFVAWLSDFPEHPSRDVALHDGALYLEQAGRHAEALALRTELVATDSGLRKPALLALAATQDDMGLFAEAARSYLAFSLEYPEEPQAAEAALRAGVLFEAQGLLADALPAYQQALRLEHPERAALLLQVAALQTDKEAKATLRRALEEGVIEAWEPLWRLDPSLVDEALAQEELPQDLRGEMLFSRIDVEAYDALQLSGPEASLKKQFVDKSRALRDIEGQVSLVIATGSGEWGIASLVLLGQAYEAFGESLLQSARPALEDEALDYYEAGLADQDAVLRMKAEEAYELALAKSFELGITNEHTDRALDRLRVLDPLDWPEQQEELIEAGDPPPTTESYEERL